jgi:nitrite reductase (NO-forming)
MLRQTTTLRTIAAIGFLFSTLGVWLARGDTIQYVIRDPADIPPPITRTEPTTVHIRSTIQEFAAEFTPGTTYPFWTFDGTVPGPLFRVMLGDTVELTLVNPATNHHRHNIDLHAVNGPHGGGEETMVAPGESKTLMFQALNTGSYIYHCAISPPWQHIAQGMYGGIIVEPPGGLAPVDREFYVVQGDWYATNANATGQRSFDFTKALAEQPTHFTFNGHTKALSTLDPMEAIVGEKVRFFFGVGGPNIGSNFHIIGEIFDKVYSGSPDTYVLNEETVYVPPGSMTILELTLNKPGDYLLVDHALVRTEKGAAGILHVSAPIPEPATGVLAALAFAGVAIGRGKRRHN